MNKKRYAVLILSLLGIYILAPDLNSNNGLMVSGCFAMIMVINSGFVPQARYFLRYTLFILIDIATYFMLFNEQPWDFFLHGGLFESGPVPLIACSVIMALAGGLLLKSDHDRKIYAAITLGLQIPIAIFVGTPFMEGLLLRLSNILGYAHSYHGAWQAWQFEWMLTYFLPIHFLNNQYDQKADIS